MAGEMKKPFGDASDIMMPASDQAVAHLAEVAAMRQMSDTLGRMGTLMQTQTDRLEMLGDKVAAMHTDIEVMKVRDERTAELAEELKLMKGKVEAIELIHAQQVGAGKTLTWMKEFGPWLLALLLGAWGLLDRAPKQEELQRPATHITEAAPAQR